MVERVLAVFRITFLELLRNKILFVIPFFAVMVVSLSSFYGSVAVGDTLKIIKDFGIFSVSLFNVLFAVIAGASLLHKELAKKTIYNVLSKAVHRREFLLGKFLGISAVSIVLVVGMGSGLLLYVAFYESKLSLPLVQALFYVILEGLIISAAAIFFSSIVITPLLIGLFTFFFFVAGRSAAAMVDFAKLINASAIELCYWIIPHLDLLYAGNEAVFNILRSGQNMIYSLIYAISYSFVLLFLATIFFEKRHFN